MLVSGVQQRDLIIHISPGVDNDGQGSLSCCSPWVAESDMTEQLNCYVYLFFFRFFSHIVYYRVMSTVPRAIQWVLVDYLFSGPISSWEIDGETVETVRLYFWGLQNHCRW